MEVGVPPARAAALRLAGCRLGGMACPNRRIYLGRLQVGFSDTVAALAIAAIWSKTPAWHSESTPTAYNTTDKSNATMRVPEWYSGLALSPFARLRGPNLGRKEGPSLVSHMMIGCHPHLKSGRTNRTYGEGATQARSCPSPNRNWETIWTTLRSCFNDSLPPILDTKCIVDAF